MKTFKRLVVSIVSLSLTVSLTGCGIIREMMSILNGSYPEETSRSEPTSYEKVETMIGKDGGVVKDEEENVTISIPQGALQEDTNISAQYIEEPSYLEANPSMNFLGAVEFGPSGTTFDKPVEVSLQLTDTPKNNKISIFCYSEEYDIWNYVTDASVSNNIATFNISHFSKYKALDISMEMLMKFNDLVRQAQATGQSDSWIHENFKNYLINEEHVMDIYSYFGGYWYEPCGLIIGGNYHINGKEGDPNELTELIGETNKVGNTYGLCHDGQLIVDSKTYKKIVGQPKEGQETISVNVGIYYKMIKPDIDLTASKKKLNKGENATINIRCHYVNVTNYFDEYKDLEMSNYMLTIAKPSHFDIDKSAVLTDDEGLASFVITAKENNKAETITVNFDVTGDFGTHAEGNITLGSSGYEITGHAKETLNIVYHAKSPEGSPTSRQNGTIALEIEYDITGSFEIDGTVIEGTIEYSNISIEFSSSPCLDVYDYSLPGGDSLHVELGYYVFATHSASSSSSVSFALSGTFNKATNAVSLSYGNDNEIAKVEGKTTGYGETGGIIDTEGSGAYNTTAVVSAREQSINDYVLGSGSQGYNASAFLDNFSLDIDYDFNLDPDGLNPTFPDLNNYQGSTNTTIEISGVAPRE